MSTKTYESPRIALVYDRVNKIGGAEKVLEQLHQIWPEAPLYTSVWNKATAPWSEQIDVRASFLNRIPFARTRHEWLAWLMPTVFESFSFEKYDIIISITSAEAKGIITLPEKLHLCYMLTPTRYLWNKTHLYRQQGFVANNPLTRMIAAPLMSRLRRWDYYAGQRPDQIVAISKTVSHRVEKYYRRPADAVIYPPVSQLTSGNPVPEEVDTPYFLVVSRLVPYKRIDLAVQAFNQLGKNLVIVGDGSQYRHLKQMAKPNVKLVGKVSQSRLASFFEHASGLVFPSEEDFGIVCLEAQSLGKGVIAYNKGGASETVIHGKTGVLFESQTVESLITAIQDFEKQNFKKSDISKNAKAYSERVFRNNFKNYVEDAWQQHQKTIK